MIVNGAKLTGSANSLIKTIELFHVAIRNLPVMLTVTSLWLHSKTTSGHTYVRNSDSQVCRRITRWVRLDHSHTTTRCL